MTPLVEPQTLIIICAIAFLLYLVRLAVALLAAGPAERGFIWQFAGWWFAATAAHGLGFAYFVNEKTMLTPTILTGSYVFLCIYFTLLRRRPTREMRR